MSRLDDLLDNFSAECWARKFVDHVTEHPQLALDEAAVASWFSAAINAGKAQALSPVAKQLRRRMRFILLVLVMASLSVAADFILLIWR